MLRKIIKTLIPSKGDIFFNFFVEAAKNVHASANMLAMIINSQDNGEEAQLSMNLRANKQLAVEIEAKVIHELSRQFITPIDRGDIKELSGLLLKLTKRIVKINQKLNVYSIDTRADDCLIKSANTLQNITKVLVGIMIALKKGNYDSIARGHQKTDEFDDSAIEDLRHAMNEISNSSYDTITVLKLKEIYQSIEIAIDNSVNIADLVVQISVKDM